MRALLVFMVCLGCASGAPSRYERGAAPPVAPSFNPTADSPITTGQPGHLRQPLPRSPHQRQLPPSKEPGLWSGDRPRASTQRTGPLVIFGEALPVEEAGDRDSVSVRACEDILHGAVVNDPDNVHSAVRNLTKDQRYCAALRAFTTCLGMMSKTVLLKDDAPRAESLKARLEKGATARCDKHAATSDEVTSAVLVSMVRGDAFNSGSGGSNAH